MMPALFRFIAEPSTVRLDLNDTSGFFLTGPPDMGTPELQSVWLSQIPYDGSVLASSRKGNATMSLPMALRAQADSATWMTLVNNLFIELDRATNVIEFRPVGAGSSYFIDTYRATLPSFVVDSPSDSVHLNTVTFSLAIARKPALRGAGVHV